MIAYLILVFALNVVLCFSSLFCLYNFSLFTFFWRGFSCIDWFDACSLVFSGGLLTASVTIEFAYRSKRKKILYHFQHQDLKNERGGKKWMGKKKICCFWGMKDQKSTTIWLSFLVCFAFFSFLQITQQKKNFFCYDFFCSFFCFPSNFAVFAFSPPLAFWLWFIFKCVC